jgi:DNA polymerase III epsilon subunit-like protein
VTASGTPVAAFTARRELQTYLRRRLDPLDGHRLVEIGAVELVNRSPTGRTFHRYVRPQRAVPADAPPPEPIYYCATGAEFPAFAPCKEIKSTRDI